jgi:hypothetical protein
MHHKRQDVLMIDVLTMQLLPSGQAHGALMARCAAHVFQQVVQACSTHVRCCPGPACTGRTCIFIKDDN